MRLADRLLLEPESEWVAGATVLDVTQVFDFVAEWVTGKGGDDLATLPCTRPPWDRTFAEFAVQGRRMGAAFDLVRIEDEREVFQFRSFAWWERDDSLVRFSPTPGELTFDRAGKWNGGRDYHEVEKWPENLAMCNDNMVAWLIFAFSLAHCRNIEMRSVVAAPQLQKARSKRKKRPLLDYTVLEIGKVARLADDLIRRNPGMTRREACLHVVRAHPMRTRSGAITLRHEHYRGNPLRGVKLKDYELAGHTDTQGAAE